MDTNLPKENPAAPGAQENRAAAKNHRAEAKLSLSAAMTSFNASGYLIEQLDSLRLQKRPFDEVVIVDDASSDRSVRMIEDYIRKYDLQHWHLHVNKHNQGYIASFRKALSFCTKEMIFLCDHDDVWKEDKTEKMAAAMESHPEMQCLLCSFVQMDAEGKIIENAENGSGHQKKGTGNNGLIHRPVEKNGLNRLNLQDIAWYNAGPGCTAAVRRAVARQYLQTPFSPHLPHDWSLYWIAAEENGLYYLDLPLVHYRIHSSNTLGLTRAATLGQRAKRAAMDRDAKAELLKLAGLTDPLSAELLAPIARLYQKRADALQRRSLPALLGVFTLPLWVWKPVFRTLALDLVTIVRGPKEEGA